MSEALIEEHLALYVAEDGGGRLTVDDTQPPILGCKCERTNNENPILYLVQPAIEFCEKYPKYYPIYKALYEKHMASTEIEEGLHSRRCGDRFLIRQSQDNIIAMVIGGWYFKSEYARKVHDFCYHHSWNYNVKDPDKFDFRCQLQGGDVAIIQWCAGFTPTPEDVIWLSAGLSVTRSFNTADLRLKFLELFKKQRPIDKLILSPGVWAHNLRRGPRTGGFFPPGHPFRSFVGGT